MAYAIKRRTAIGDPTNAGCKDPIKILSIG